jgi:cystathionine beta-lyase
MDSSRPLAKETLLQHLGEEEKIKGAVAPPIFMNSLFVFPNQADFDATSSCFVDKQGYYSRVGNPSLEIAEKKIAMLEGTESCRLVGSGMAAITTAIMSCVVSGSHIVVVDTCYGPARDFIVSYLKPFGVTHTFVDGRSTEAVLGAITSETTMVYLESPSSVVFRLQDLEAIAGACRAKGITTVCDNTYATPLYQQPHALGIDIIVHSVTKYLGGHSDVVAGAICCSRARMDRIVKQEIALFGSILNPFGGWMVTRSLRTLKLRLKAHEATGNTIAKWLEAQPWVDVVHHVGSATFPQNELYRKQMQGSGGLLSFEPKNQDRKASERFVDALEIFGLGVSWGGFESLSVQFPYKPMDYPTARQVVRLFCGLEDPDDLIADLDQAARLAWG